MVSQIGLTLLIKLVRENLHVSFNSEEDNQNNVD